MVEIGARTAIRSGERRRSSQAKRGIHNGEKQRAKEPTLAHAPPQGRAGHPFWRGCADWVSFISSSPVAAKREPGRGAGGGILRAIAPRNAYEDMGSMS